MTSDEVFEAISHPLRIVILREVAKKPIRFADLKRNLRIKSGGQLDFHLKKMQSVITTDDKGLYTITTHGYAALRAVHVVSNYGWQKRSWLMNILMMTFLNVYFLFAAFEYYIFAAIPTIGWALFYSYWTFVKRGVRLRDNGVSADDVEVT
ncbi:ArsR family transcriptional regulator [Candidatus Thorarchaeota archaeon]|nr:MAG: ArsR family transcriptional regulator [Candidatus Thorarchaeota archaeon]